MNENIILFDPNTLNSHEEISRLKAVFLAFKIMYQGTFTRPILVDKTTKVILDGHHRCWVSRKLGFKAVPCYEVDYLMNDKISLDSRREDVSVSKGLVLRMGLSDNVFKRKTTRHTFEVSACNFKLSYLRNYKNESIN